MDPAIAVVARTFASILVVARLVLGVIVWAVRRTAPSVGDPAVAERKRRLATGEIGPVEYEARFDALRRR